MLSEGRWIIRYGDIFDVPIFARAGAIVPMLENGFEVSFLFGMLIGLTH